MNLLIVGPLSFRMHPFNYLLLLSHSLYLLCQTDELSHHQQQVLRSITDTLQAILIEIYVIRHTYSSESRFDIVLKICKHSFQISIASFSNCA
jgi:hypothetical protein